MKKFILINHRELTQKAVDTPFTVKQWISYHFGSWGFYKIEKISSKEYRIHNTVENTIDYTILL
jgi:hypothetical protein